MAALWVSAILGLLVGSVTSDFISDVCSIPKRSDGIIQPPLPTNFELKGEYVNHLQKVARYEEVYFDYDNSRAKFMYLMNGIQHHYLFDYETEQIVEWDILHPGVSIKRDPLSHVCSAVDMDDAPERNFFGYQLAPGTLKPKMFNSNQVLRYGGQFLYAANGTEKLDNRGLLCNKFVGCLYDRFLDATMLNTYYFSSDKVEPAGATTVMEVLGPDAGYLSIPVRLELTGAMFNETGDIVRLNETYSISWFKGEPEFQMGTFQIPPWIHCNNYRGRKDMPKLPTAFYTRLAITQFQVDILGEMAATESESFEEIYYYGEKNLARRDFTPNPSLDTDILSKFQSTSPVATIYDFNQGLRYTISKPTGRCYIVPIQENEFFDTEKDLLDRRLATPEELFLMQMDDMEYKGKAFTRDIECDVWNGRHFHKLYNANFTKETYISTNGWHTGADEMQEYGVPVKHMVIKSELDGELTEGISAYNFLKFKAKAPWVGHFDVRNCVELITHKRFAIVLTVSTEVRDLLFDYRFQFHETAQYYIADMAQVMTPLRVQRLHLRRQSVNDPTPILVFTLLDKADLNDYPVPVGQTGATLDEAIINLQKVVDYNRFAIQFYPPKSTEPKLVAARAGDMYQLLPGGDLTLTPMRRLEEANEVKPETAKKIKIAEANLVQHDDLSLAINEEKKGMTPGHLALLAVAMMCIGIGIGIACMYLYIRMYTDRQVEDRINLTTKKSDLEAKLESVEESPSE